MTFAVPNPAPLVSILSHGPRASDWTQTLSASYPTFEIIEVDEEGGSFGERINRAAVRAKGAVLVLLGRDLEMVAGDFLN